MQQSLISDDKELAQSDILRMYLKLPRAFKKHDVTRDAKTFRNSVWPCLEYRRKRDTKIRVLEAKSLRFGRVEKTWAIAL